MVINNFLAKLQLYPSHIHQHLLVQIEIVSEESDEMVQTAEKIVSDFAEACDLGLLCGDKNDPTESRLLRFRYQQVLGLLKWNILLEAIDGGSVRVLIGMLRGGMPDGVVRFVSVSTETDMSDEGLISLTDEKKLSLPNLYEKLGFPLIRHESMRAKTDRLVRVMFFDKPYPKQLERLIQIQKAWVNVCEGGFYSGDKQAVEFGILCDTGYLVAPRIFEIGIRIFDNEENCFDILANGLHRYSVTEQPIKEMHIW